MQPVTKLASGIGQPLRLGHYPLWVLQIELVPG
jgi:hypothetical protein